MILPIQKDIVDQYSSGSDGLDTFTEISEPKVDEHPYGDDGLVATPEDDGEVAIDEIDTANIDSTDDEGDSGNDQGSDDSADSTDAVEFDDNQSLDNLE